MPVHHRRVVALAVGTRPPAVGTRERRVGQLCNVPAEPEHRPRSRPNVGEEGNRQRLAKSRSHIDNGRVLRHLAAVVEGYRLEHRLGEVRDEVRRQIRGLGCVGSVASLVVEQHQRSPMRRGIAGDSAILGRHANRGRHQPFDRTGDCSQSHSGLNHQDDRDRDNDHGGPGMRQAAGHPGSKTSRQQ